MITTATQTAAKAEGPAPETAVLVIEPNEEHQVLSTMALGRRGFRVTVAGTAREGLRLALTQKFAAIVLDFKVRDTPALEVLAVLAERRPDVPKIFVVAPGQEATAVRALSSGASGYLVKTARYNELLPSEVESQIRAAGARKSLKEQKKALKESEERFQKAFRASPVAIGLTTRETGEFIDANRAFLELFGYARDELIGRSAEALGLYVQDADFARTRSIVAAEGSLRDASAHMRTKDGRVQDVSLSVESTEIEGTPCFLTIVRDVTQQRQDERLRAALFDIVEATESAGDLPELYRRIHTAVAGLMPAENCYIALYDAATNQLSFPYFVDQKEPAPAPYPAGRGLTEYVIRTGNPLLVSPESLARLMAGGEVEQVGAEGIDWLGVPLIAQGRTLGVLAVQSYAETTRYTEREKGILTFVSSQVAMAIDRKASQDALRQAEARFRTIFRDAPIGILLVSTDGLIQETNQAFERMLGYIAGEIRGKHIRDITAPEDVPESLRLFDSLVRGERAGFLLEKRYVRKEGTPVWVRLTASMFRGGEGGPAAVLGMVQDVTEEHRALEARDADHRRFQTLIEHISDGITLIGADGLVMWQSPSAQRMFGYAPGEAIGRSGLEFIHPEDAIQVAEALADLVSKPGKTSSAEFRIRHKDGSWRWMEAVGTNLLQDPGLGALVMNFRDITERNEALEQIRFQASLLTRVRNAVIAVDQDLHVVYWNEAAAAMYGWSFAEVAGRSLSSFLVPQEAQPSAEGLLREARETGHWAGERMMLRKDGSTFAAEVSLTPLLDRNEAVIGYVGVSTDVTERVRARRDLETRARQQMAIAALGRRALIEPLVSTLMQDAVELLARTLGVEFASALQLLPEQARFLMKAQMGWGTALREAVTTDPQATMAGYTMSVKAAVVMDDAEQETRFRIPSSFVDRSIRSGIAVPIPGPSQPYGILAVHATQKQRFTQDDVYFCESIANVIADALERNRIEKVLGQNERMASMGQLAAYVAHEVNTPLTNISLLASGILRREKDPEIVAKVQAIGDQRRRATAIITDILEFPRQRSSRRVPEDVRNVIASAVEQIAPFRKDGVGLAVETGDHSVFANIDVIQIRDVLVNLLKNALQATDRGEVRVTLKDWPEFLFVTVSDTGTGMPPEVLDQLFHRDDSAGLPAEGTGLGLALCRTIVTAHGGKIEASSEPGKGSSFTVVLPRFEVH